jgi:hypothetical protein
MCASASSEALGLHRTTENVNERTSNDHEQIGARDSGAALARETAMTHNARHQRLQSLSMVFVSVPKLLALSVANSQIVLKELALL